MKRRIIALILVLLLLTGCFAGCGKDSEAKQENGPTSDQQQSLQTKYAYQAEYIPLSLDGMNINYINGFRVSGDRIFMLASCITGKEILTDEITGEPYLDGDGKPVEVDRETVRLFSMNLDGSGIVQLDYTMPEPEEGSHGYGYASGLTAGADGSVWFYDQLQTYRFDLPEDFDYETGDAYAYYVDEGMAMVCHQYDAQGNAVESIELDVGEGVYLGMVLVAPDGTIYASDWINIYQFDHQGKISGSIALENGFNTMQMMKDGSVGVSVWDENGMLLKRLDPDTMTLGEGTPLPDSAYSLLPGIETYDYLYESNSAIYGLSGTQEPERLFSWLDCDVDTSYMNGYEILQDGTVYALEGIYSEEGTDYNLIVMKQVDASALPQKQILTLACLYLDWDVRSEIVTFNKANNDVRIVVKDYSEYATDGDYQAAVQKLNTEILSGMVPDLFYIDESMPMEIYAAKGILQDIWPLIDADPDLSRDDLMTHFFDSISTDGKLYRVVDTFGIETAVGRRDVVGDGEGWNLNELLQVYETLEPGASIFGEMDIKEYMIDTVITRSSNNFVDWKNGRCSFDSQEFIDLLNFVNRFPTEFDYDNYNWEDYRSEGLRMRMRQQLLLQSYVTSFDTVMYQNAMTDGMPSYIGYPSTDGTGSNFRIYGGFSISAGCTNTEAAWSFVRQYLTEAYQSGSYMYQFPTNRHAFEKYTEEFMTPQYGNSDYGIAVPVREMAGASIIPGEEGAESEQVEMPRGSYWFSDDEVVEYYTLSQEELDVFMDLYEKTNSLSTFNHHINTIIEEECEAFFAGQKTAEETARLIQDRATLYVFEQA